MKGLPSFELIASTLRAMAAEEELRLI